MNGIVALNAALMKWVSDKSVTITRRVTHISASGPGEMDIRKLALIGLLLTLGACGMPSGIAALSYAMNGVSYASSGKGVADHALSAAADKDCAMLRAVQGVDICASDGRGNAKSLMTMIEYTPVVIDPTGVPAEQLNKSPSVQLTQRSADKAPATGGNRSMSAIESIYGQSR